MSALAEQTFSDPDEYAHAVRAARVEGYVTNDAAKFRAALVKVEIGRVWVQAGSDSAPRSLHINVSPERVPIFFLRDVPQGSTKHSGIDLSSKELVFFARNASHFHRTEGVSHWATMSLSPQDFAAASLALMGRDLSERATTRVIRPEAHLMSRLKSLHDMGRRIGGQAPATIGHPEAARGLEQALMHAMVACLAAGEDVEADRGFQGHVAVMARFEEWLEENLDRPVYLADACDAVGVSERVLRYCCREHLSMSPNRYLILRRMHLAHTALVRGSPGTTTVAAIAMDFGFWEIGRFSVAYRQHFGESPKVTLFRPIGSTTESHGSFPGLPKLHRRL